MDDDALFCSGSFDHFHAGHRTFLKVCAGIGKRLLVGVEEAPPLSDQSFKTRSGAVASFLSDERISFEIFPLDSGSLNHLALRPDVKFIGLSSRDRSVAEELNQKRVEQKMAPMVIIEIPLIPARDNQPLTSARIRDGLINERGELVTATTPPKTTSAIRNNFIEIFLTEKGPLYGYQINKKYILRYGRLSLRLTYYHLSRGVAEGVFKIVEKRKTAGGYSWGEASERVYYELAG
jgi:pantetheine-phosphate adenylyltransferase